MGCFFFFIYFLLYLGACYCRVPVGAPKRSVQIQLRAVRSAENPEMPFSKNRREKLAAPSLLFFSKIEKKQNTEKTYAYEILIFIKKDGRPAFFFF